VRLAAHGIALELPRGWDGRLFRVAGSDPILHAASFPLPPTDGDFGSGATAIMPARGAFLTLKEYRAGPRLLPGAGLFAARSIPLPLKPGRFHPRALQVTRSGHAGFQHFFTSSARPFCLYAVIEIGAPCAAAAALAPDRVGELTRILSTLEIGPRP
jgi:hypothetical protein